MSQKGPDLVTEGLCAFVDANRLPNPQEDQQGRLRLRGQLPVPSDGFMAWECFSGRPVIFGWWLGRGPAEGSRYREVPLVLGPSDRLGLVATREGCITAIEGGAADRWNRAHPENQVMVGDRIVAVNGKLVSRSKTLEEQAESGKLSLRLKGQDRSVPDRHAAYHGGPRRLRPQTPLAADEPLSPQDAPGPQEFEKPLDLPSSFTVAFWARFSAAGEPQDDQPAPAILRFSHPSGQPAPSALALSADGLRVVTLGANGVPVSKIAPGSGPGLVVPRSRWVLLMLCSSAGGCTVFRAEDSRGIRRLGELAGPTGGCQLNALGGGAVCGHIAQLAVWGRVLSTEEHVKLFCADGVRFGCLSDEEADAVASGRPPPRTKNQEAEFQERLQLARNGGADGVASFCDFQGFEVHDRDLAEILEAVAVGGCQKLLLGGAALKPAGVLELLAELQDSSGGLYHVDLQGVDAVGQVSKDLLAGFPYAKGCSINAEGCGLDGSAVQKLANATKEAEDAMQAIVKRKEESKLEVEKYQAQQEALMQEAAEERPVDGAPPPPPDPLYTPGRWQKGFDTKAKAALGAFAEKNKAFLCSGREVPIVDKSNNEITIDDEMATSLDLLRDEILKKAGMVMDEEEEADPMARQPGLQDLRAALESCSSAAAADNEPLPWLTALTGFMVHEGASTDTDALDAAKKRWEAAWLERQKRRDQVSSSAKEIYDGGSGSIFSGAGALPKNVGSGQLLSHFTYLACKARPGEFPGGELPEGASPQDPSVFGFKSLKDAPRSSTSKRNAGALDIHDALSQKKIVIEAATGDGFGKDSLKLKLRNLTKEAQQITVRKGTIFQQGSWEHRQNLCVAMAQSLTVPPGGEVEKALYAYCMNVSCACPSNSPMNLTEFYVDDALALESQGGMWNCMEKRLAGIKEHPAVGAAENAGDAAVPES